MQYVKDRRESADVCLKVYVEAVVNVCAVRRRGLQMKEAESGVAVFHGESGVVTLELQPSSILLADELIAWRSFHNNG